jgi:translation initiation factor IF-1
MEFFREKYTNGTDEILLRTLPEAKSASEVIAMYHDWVKNGDNYKLIGKILSRLGEFGAGNSEIIEILEREGKHWDIWRYNSAIHALKQIAKVDDSAQAPLLQCQEFQENDRLSTKARSLNITVKELKEQERVEAEIRQKKEQERQKELAEIRADVHGKKRYGESKFQPGDRVVCLIESWPYTGEIGQVERALNTKTVYVRFSDGYVTIQGDDKFALQPDGSDDTG